MRGMRIKYRVGVMPGPWTTNGDGVELFWRFIDLCEGTDIDSVWFSDRLTSPLPVLEPMATMAAVAARTRRLKFGPSVLIAPFRSPVLLARELAMIDYLSNGRMLPAVGVGAEQDREFRAAGIPAKERGRRTDETIRILRRCWSDDEVTFDGEFFQLERVTVLPKPRQQPFPLWIGGNTEVAMRRAGHLGDGWIPSFITPDNFAAGVGKTQSFAAAAGREVPADHFGVLIYFGFAADRATARAVATPFIPRNRVDDATLEQCAAFGPPDVLIERLEAYIRGGASKFILRPMVPAERMLEQLSRLAEEVVPIFHAR
jgi:probable F420-dependent oxidoreductase